MELQSDNSKAENLKSENPLGLVSEERKLPLITLGTQPYKIDLANGELRNANDPLRTIAFHAMKREEDQYSFLYDVKNDRVVLDKSEWGDLSTKQWITLPSIEKLDPQFVKRIVYEEECQLDFIRHGASIYSDNGVWTPRAMGALLPIVNLYGTDFFLDTRLKEFREVENPHNSIPWKALNSEDYHYSLLYDAERKNVYDGPGAWLNESSRVKFLFLPPVDIMIEEGIARHQKKLESKTHVMENPSRPKRKKLHR